MSYPEPVYHGESGTADASFRPANQSPDIVFPSGGMAHYLATGAKTDGHFGLYRWEMAATPSGPGPHFHKTMSESFYVLEGTVRLYDGEKWIEGKPGDFMHVAPGGVHGFRNESMEPAAMLILFTPGAPREEYFETLAQLAEGLVMSDEEKREFLIRHDNHNVEE